jgi:RNA polymerase sigma-70 factor (ECF subfamily)
LSENLKNNDPILLSRFIETGDLEILGELYQPYIPLVYGVCLKYLQDRESSKDAVMQIFEKLITDIPKNDIQNFKSWLYVVTKNYCLMQIRSDKSKKENQKKFQIEQEIFVESENEMHPIDEMQQNDPG